MYNNELAKWVLGMQNGDVIWGPFTWFDMFTWHGFLNYIGDLWLLDFAFPVLLIIAIVRDAEKNWQLGGTLRQDDPPDMNNLVPALFAPDRFNREYWMSYEYGLDCNGNMGQGNYCYCPSQGYICTCKPDSWKKDERKIECYDHYGYDCLGNVVDGEYAWCREPDSTFTHLNE